jgi:hypothetical protein
MKGKRKALIVEFVLLTGAGATLGLAAAWIQTRFGINPTIIKLLFCGLGLIGLIAGLLCAYQFYRDWNNEEE